jgi:hypothetical protein
MEDSYDDPDVVWADEDVTNADWLRANTWDLPTDVEGFLDVIGGRKRLPHFMQLPAAQAMPDDLRRDLGV